MNTNKFTSLAQWLAWISSIHPKEIALGLERVKEVSQRLAFKRPSCPVIIVGGTNGKGSCVATLEKIYSSQGYRTGVFTSPILFRHNELVRIQGKEVEDHFFCEAYLRIEEARKQSSLTPFEYHTLAALDIFSRHDLDVWILEVGLGGRLDAVNILDADLAIVSSIGIDHVDWLGNTREEIGREKAGIFRSGCPVVCGDFDPPFSLREQAAKLSAPFYCQGQDFTYSLEETCWSWQGNTSAYSHLPFSKLACQNISTVLMGIELLQSRLPVREESVYQGIKMVSLPGRIEIIPGAITEIRDVAHNPAAMMFLAERLKKISPSGRRRAVFSMLADKDLAGSLKEIKNLIDEWHVAPLAVKRGAGLEILREAFEVEGISGVQFYASVADAYQGARKVAIEKDQVLVFGSFHTVAEVVGIEG